MVNDPPPPAPRGREAVREALLNAAAELFAARGPANVPVREIAAAASVNHGLVHRHFGSKQELQRAVLSRLADEVHDSLRAPSDAPISELLREAFMRTRDHQHYFRILAWLLLAGEPLDDLQTNFPVVRRLVEAAARSGDPTPSETVARALALGLGWLVFEPYIRQATGVDESRLDPM